MMKRENIGSKIRFKEKNEKGEEEPWKNKCKSRANKYKMRGKSKLYVYCLREEMDCLFKQVFFFLFFFDLLFPLQVPSSHNLTKKLRRLCILYMCGYHVKDLSHVAKK